MLTQLGWKPLVRDEKWKALFEAKQRELEREEGCRRKEGILEIKTQPLEIDAGDKKEVVKEDNAMAQSVDEFGPEPRQSSNTVKMRFHTDQGLIERRFRVDDTLETVNKFLASKGENDVQIVTYDSSKETGRSFRSLSKEMAKMSLRELGLVGALAFAIPNKPTA